MIDTSPEAAAVLSETYRKMSRARKWLQLGEIYACAKLLAEAGVRLRDPCASPDDIRDAWMSITIDPLLLQSVRELRNAAR